MLAPPADPALIPAAIAQQAWNIGCTTKFGSRIADSHVEVIDDCGHVIQAD